MEEIQVISLDSLKKTHSPFWRNDFSKSEETHDHLDFIKELNIKSKRNEMTSFTSLTCIFNGLVKL